MSESYWLNESAAKTAENDLLKAEVEVRNSALRWFVAAYDNTYPFREADQHPTDCACLRCARDAAEYLTRTDGKTTPSTS